MIDDLARLYVLRRHGPPPPVDLDDEADDKQQQPEPGRIPGWIDESN